MEAGKQVAASPVGFTAVAAMADVVALSVMEGLRLSGLRAPEDVSVTGGKKVDVELVERESVMALE